MQVKAKPDHIDAEMKPSFESDWRGDIMTAQIIDGKQIIEVMIREEIRAGG